jgi:uncharacterized protein DUF4389
MSQYPPAPGPEGPPMPVLVSVAPPAKQRWITVAFRLILVIPHVVVLWALGTFAAILVIIGWFAALFTGRLPDFCASFLVVYLRWYLRVMAYLLLLTDVYPPFALEGDGYPVRFAIQPGRLSRLAVLFRIILVIPAAVLAILLQYGVATIVLFIAWLITLITGSLPASLHQAFAAVLRFQARYLGYAYLLTATYPGGLFGDRQTSGYAAPGYAAPGYGTPDYGVPGVGMPGPLQPPTEWQLTLGDGARLLVIVFIVLGAVTGVGGIAFDTNLTGKVNAAEAAVQVQNAYQRLTSQVSGLESDEASCKQAPQPLTCAESVLKSMASDMTAFNTSIQNTAMPDDAAADQGKLEADTTEATRILNQLSTAQSISQYTTILASSNLTAYLNGITSDSQALYKSLGGLQDAG